MILPNNPFDSSDVLWTKGAIVHELAHVWDTRQFFQPSSGMMYATKSYRHICQKSQPRGVESCYDYYDSTNAIEEAPTDYAKGTVFDDWAESFRVFMYKGPSERQLKSIRRTYIEKIIQELP